MKTTANILVAAMMVAGVGCAAETAGDASGTGAAEQGVTSAPASSARFTEAHIAFTAREELRAALDAAAPGPAELDFRTVSVPGVLAIEHQYSIAAVRFEVASWQLLPSETQPRQASLLFPHSFSSRSRSDWEAGAKAAEKLFHAMTNTTPVVEQNPHATVTKRASAQGTFECSETVLPGDAPRYFCLVHGLSTVGSGGLFWGGGE